MREYIVTEYNKEFWAGLSLKEISELLLSAPKNIANKWQKKEATITYIQRNSAFGNMVVAEIIKSEHTKLYYWTACLVAKKEIYPYYEMDGSGKSKTLKEAKYQCDARLKKLGWILVN